MTAQSDACAGERSQTRLYEVSALRTETPDSGESVASIVGLSKRFPLPKPNPSLVGNMCTGRRRQLRVRRGEALGLVGNRVPARRP